MLNPQIKKGLLDTIVLSALLRGDSYGYKIIKDLSPCIRLSESTLYPVLRRLEAGGALTVYSLEHNGRLRKMYRLSLIHISRHIDGQRIFIYKAVCLPQAHHQVCLLYTSRCV